jgi:4'-phosphopantetheinyl transferase
MDRPNLLTTKIRRVVDYQVIELSASGTLNTGDARVAAAIASAQSETIGRSSKPGEVAVWWMELGSPPATAVERWRTCLNEAERIRADRFHFNEDKSTYIAAHWLIRNALASVGGLPPIDWRFAVGKHGKPTVAPAVGQPALSFNLSHTRGFVAGAVSIDHQIGIDVETLSPGLAVIDIAEGFFNPSEVAILHATEQDEQHRIFFRLWTLKEAFIKATGEGLSRPLTSFSFSLDPVVITFGPGDAENATQWEFIELQPTPRHLLTLAIRRSATWPASLSIYQLRAPR